MCLNITVNLNQVNIVISQYINLMVTTLQKKKKKTTLDTQKNKEKGTQAY